MILSVAIVQGFKREIEGKIRGFSGDIVIARYNLKSPLECPPFVLKKNTWHLIKRDPQITSAYPYIDKAGIIFNHKDFEGVILRGVDKTYPWPFLQNSLIAGRVIDFSDRLKAKQEIVVSQALANRLNLKLGDQCLLYFIQQPLRKRKLTIVGIYSLGFEELDKMYLISDLSVIQRLNNWEPNEICAYAIHVKSLDQLEETSAKVRNTLDVGLKSSTIKENYPAVFEWLSMLDVNTQVILILMLIVGIINMTSALLVIILERTNTIGILKTLGSNNWGIQKIFLMNAAYLIGIGLAMGNILGIGLVMLQKKTHMITLDKASYYISYVPTYLTFNDIIALNIGIMFIGILALTIPTLIVSTIAPIKAILFK